ncbi:hypothetical protein PACTADRAFT_49660 [Pachysolen tannophilus NRRL Y-2460]|uniref:Methyltransferase domain-containing protein n=1 Tax=Pachysolen tannophilus NRRL Y-2460 TaxID=669874 RepID=A0A1E4TWW7_PACTA|nr:hypothetical protein PACTADRAFT_49660 [Pachysolen tannophilus NRRL Y-2460]
MFFKNQQGNLIKPKNLIDTYCGSGFFGISLSDNFAKIIGIEISREGYLSSIENARLNNLQNAKFVLGSAENIFKSHELNVNPAESVVIMDPSRKGSNLSFMKQLSNFKPSLIIYISCNVFTQARDLYSFFEKTENGHCYKIREIKGIDFFPQTRHVESVAILELKD